MNHNRLIFCIILFLLVGCNLVSLENEASEETTVEPVISPSPPITIPISSTATTVPIPPTATFVTPTPTLVPKTTFYYLLSEQTAEIIELDPNNLREMRRFRLPLPNAGNAGPEGLTYVSNEDVAAYGLFGLEASVHGGYFLVSVQEDGRVYVVDVPLEERGSGTAVILHSFTIPSLDEDASGLAYQNGTLWIAMAKKQRLYAINTSLIDGEVVVQERYNLKNLPFDANDTEGIIFPDAAWQTDGIFLADDKGRSISLYVNFPACLAPEVCERIWFYETDLVEPSGLAWDHESQRLVVVGDEGQVIRFDIASDDQELIIQLPDDLEGVVAIRRSYTP